MANTRWLAYRTGRTSGLEEQATPARPALGKGMRVPREVGHRPDGGQVGQAALPRARIAVTQLLLRRPDQIDRQRDSELSLRIRDRFEG